MNGPTLHQNKDALATTQRVFELNPECPAAVATLDQWQNELSGRRWFS